MKLNLNAKQLDPQVNYCKFEPIVLENPSVPFTQVTRREVRGNLRKSIIASIPIYLLSASKSMANSPNTSSSTLSPQDFLEQSGIGELVNFVDYLIPVTISTGGKLTILLLAIAGVAIMFKKSKWAAEWVGDIIKGYGQVLMAVPIVVFILGLMYILFGNLPIFNSPIDAFFPR